MIVRRSFDFSFGKIYLIKSFLLVRHSLEKAILLLLLLRGFFSNGAGDLQVFCFCTEEKVTACRPLSTSVLVVRNRCYCKNLKLEEGNKCHDS